MIQILRKLFKKSEPEPIEVGDIWRLGSVFFFMVKRVENGHVFYEQGDLYDGKFKRFSLSGESASPPEEFRDRYRFVQKVSK